MKLLAGCLLVAVGAMAGRSLAGGEARRVQALRLLAADVSRLTEAMLEKRLPLFEALSLGESRAIRRAAEAGGAPNDAWTAAREGEARRGGELDALERADLAPLDELFARVGGEGLARQRELLTTAAEGLRTRCEKAAQARDERGRLYISLGALAGMALAIWLA